MSHSPPQQVSFLVRRHEMKPLAVILGVVCGLVVGLALGILGAMALGIWPKWANPSDPSAGSVAIVVIATAPAGALRVPCLAAY